MNVQSRRGPFVEHAVRSRPLRSRKTRAKALTRALGMGVPNAFV